MSTLGARAGGRSVNQLVAMVFGVVYVVVGLLGFVVTSGVGFVATEGKNLILFEVNPLHNVVHLLIGAALLVGSRSLATARAVNVGVGGAYLLVGLLGLFLVGSSANILALNGPDNVLHFASAALLLGVGLSQDRHARALV
jgi:hypothetical protein